MNISKINFRLEEIKRKEQWHDLLTQFHDANIYQTWNFSKWAQNEKIIKHIAVYEKDNLLSIALVRVRTAPILKWGIAYIYRGPLWMKKDGQNDINTFYEIISFLRNEYLIKRNHLLRFKPSIYSDQIQSIDFDKTIKFKTVRQSEPEKTIVVYLDKEISEIRKGFTSKWRNRLNQAEKNDLEIVSGFNQELFVHFLSLYGQLIKRKKFKEYVNPYNIYIMNQEQDPRLKLIIFIAFKNKAPISALIGTAMGNTGIYLLGATNEEGMKLKASYLLQWEMIKWLKQKDIIRYDLGGIDPINNPGVYEFKTGINKNEIQDFGTYEIYNNRLLKMFVSFGEFTTKIIKF